MTEYLVTINKADLLKKTKIILEERRLLPRLCPKKRCLSLGNVTLRENNVIIQLDADPPKLPTTKKHRRYDIYPICEAECGIGGNSSRFFEVRQSLTTGKIEEVRADWRKQ